MDIELSLIVPVFNEEAVIEESYKRLTKVAQGMNCVYELIFVNDGSRDSTLSFIRQFQKADQHVQLLDFSRNFGHQLAISAGLAFARGQAVVVIDADLQDPPEVIPLMMQKWREGFEVVYGKRKKRQAETLFKKATSKLYYRFLSRITDVEIPVDVGDFRLVDRKVCDAFNSMKEGHRYVRGLISWLGFRQTAVEFERSPRFAGTTKYPLKKMVNFAIDGIVSFSSKPLKMAIVPGVIMSIAGFLYFLFILYQKLVLHATLQGWASVMCVILILNGYTLVILGIIGEYLGRLFDEAKGRPLYVVRERNFQEIKR